MRLDKYLAETAQCTRSEAKTLLQKGRVTVNGAVCKKGDTQLKDSDTVAVDGQPLAYQQFVYLMLNKPAGVVSASTDKRDTTVVDLIGDAYPRRELFPAGRLDKTSTGFSTAGATFHDVELMVKGVAGRCKVKAAGGISTVDDMEKFLALGADRLGTSRAVKILNGEQAKGY